jgi:hypothetical protein
MPPEPTPPVPALTKEQLLTVEKEELVELLLTALKGQALFTSNLQKLVDLLAEKDREANALKATVEQQQAELIVLRNQP